MTVGEPMRPEVDGRFWDAVLAHIVSVWGTSQEISSVMLMESYHQVKNTLCEELDMIDVNEQIVLLDKYGQRFTRNSVGKWTNGAIELDWYSLCLFRGPFSIYRKEN